MLFFQMIERITPPSTRNAAPLVAAESGLAMKMTSDATSSIEAKRLSNELGERFRRTLFRRSTVRCLGSERFDDGRILARQA